MSNVLNNFRKILQTILPIYQQINITKKPRRKPKMTDIEVVALSLTTANIHDIYCLSSGNKAITL